MICAIHQPQYLPWLGYFSKLDAADIFVIYDNAQYKHDEWQNRNRIKTSAGPQWLTVPVHHKQGLLINEVEIETANPWARKHSAAISQSYGRAPFFNDYSRELLRLYHRHWANLAALSTETVRLICELLGIKQQVVLASQLTYSGRATDALISICKAVGAQSYLSGSGGRNYLQMDKVAAAGLELLFHDYEHPAYAQMHGKFEPNLSTVDLLFNCGPDSLTIIRSGRRISGIETVKEIA